jgi:hypothetical protein
MAAWLQVCLVPTAIGVCENIYMHARLGMASLFAQPAASARMVQARDIVMVLLTVCKCVLSCAVQQSPL